MSSGFSAENSRSRKPKELMWIPLSAVLAWGRSGSFPDYDDAGDDGAAAVEVEMY